MASSSRGIVYERIRSQARNFFKILFLMSMYMHSFQEKNQFGIDTLIKTIIRMTIYLIFANKNKI